MARISPLSALLLASSLCATSIAFTVNSPFGVPSSSRSTGTGQNDNPIHVLMAQRRGRPRGPVRTIEVKPPMNAEIKYAELRVTIPGPPNPKSQNVKDVVLGVMTKADALAKAKELGGLDLILINENSDPPVAKIADYSKYRYEKEKKAKELKKNSKASELKEVKMSYKIDTHDYGVRIKNASKFISQGNRVKCTVMFKGREVQHDKLGFELLNRMAEDMTKICTMEGRPKREGRNLSCILSPRQEVTKAVNDKRRAEEKEKKKKKNERTKPSAADPTAATGSIGSDESTQNDGAATTIIALEDDEDDDATLDDLLGSDDLTDDLFG